MAVARLDHCVTAVSDWERAARFYRDVIGGAVATDPLVGALLADRKSDR